MIFHDIDDPDCLRCLASETDRWRITVQRMLYGTFLIQVWCRRYSPWNCCRYYDCGAGAGFGISVIQAIKRILEAQPETLTDAQAREVLPAHTIVDGHELRPIRKDRHCFQRLQQLAGMTNAQIISMWALAELLSPPDDQDALTVVMPHNPRLTGRRVC